MRIGIPFLATATAGAFLAGSLTSAASTQAQQTQPPLVYVVNFMKANPAKVREYIQLERETWKPIHQEVIRAGHQRSWALYSVQTSWQNPMEHDFVTIETFDSLADTQGNDFSAVMAKVHPSETEEDIGKRTLALRTQVVREVWSRIDSAP